MSRLRRALAAAAAAIPLIAGVVLAPDQHWKVTGLASGAYAIANAHSGLLLTMSSGSDGGLVTQQADAHTALQQWTIT